MATLTLIGCASEQKDVSLADFGGPAAQAFFHGSSELSCDVSCVWAYAAARPQLHALLAIQNWPLLAQKIISIGFNTDQAYFYLGAAAEGMGHPEAAVIYYRTALAISQNKFPGLACKGFLVDNCDGLDIAALTRSRLAALQAPGNLRTTPGDDKLI